MRAIPTVMCVAALAALSGAARADHWSPTEITKKFREHEKELKKIEGILSASNSARLRIAELEAEMRLLRRQVADLETSLRSAQEAVKGLKLDVIRAASARDASRTVRTPAAEEPVAAPAANQAVVSGEHAERSGDFTVITGLVENTGDGPLTFVVVRADFLDSRGNVVKSESVYTSPRIIGPHSKASFKINTRRDHRVRTHRLSVETK